MIRLLAAKLKGELEPSIVWIDRSPEAFPVNNKLTSYAEPVTETEVDVAERAPRATSPFGSELPEGKERVWQRLLFLCAQNDAYAI